MKARLVGLLVLLVSLFAGAAFAADVPDTHGNRLAAARSYMDAVPLKDLIRDVVDETAKNLPEDARPSYVRFMTQSIRVDVLEGATLASMARHFTVRELKALAAFYGSPEGRSAMKKFGGYMADVMPVLQQEMLRAQQQLEAQSRQRR
jgi:hypothetical protein